MIVRRGFILPLSLMLMAIAIALVARVALRMTAERGRTHYFGEQMQAQLLAEGAVPLIIAILNGEKKSEEKKKEEPRLLTVCAAMNRWQRFQFTAEREGFTGELALYLAVEQGKLDINRFYDWDKKAYRTDGQFDGKKVLEWLSDRLEGIVSERTFADVYDDLAKKRKKPFDDVGEFFGHPAMKALRRWPKSPPEEKEAAEQEKRIPALYDLFTIAAQSGTSLGVLSDSLAWCASMKAPAFTQKDDSEKILAIAQKIENPIAAADWNSLLAPLTGKEYTSLPRELVSAATSGVKNPVLSVVIESIVGEARYVCAVLLVPQSSKSESVSYTVARLYRLT